jgi:hypothetical protein
MAGTGARATFNIRVERHGFEGEMNAAVTDIAACLNALRHLSFQLTDEDYPRFAAGPFPPDANAVLMPRRASVCTRTLALHPIRSPPNLERYLVAYPSRFLSFTRAGA